MTTRTASTDEALIGEVETVLAEDPEVDAHQIRVNVTDGVVHLSGVSRSLYEIRRAEELAALQPGVRAVDSLLTVEIPHPPAEEELQEEAQTAVASVAPQLEVDVADGMAVLRGTVPDPGLLKRAIHAVEQVPGLKELRCEVAFTSLPRHEREFRQLLEEALHASYPIPGAIRIAHLYEGGVTLEGRVSTSEQRDRVLERVRQVPGMHRIVNRIRIRPNKPESAQGRHRSGAER